MIIAKLMGGLGNQMFQYALGRALSVKFNVPLKLDHSFLEMKTDAHIKRFYELNVFNIVAGRATEQEIQAFAGDGMLKKITRSLSGKKYVREKSYDFDPEVLNAGPNVYLDGFWQSYKYFEPVRDTISKDFSFKAAPSGRNETVAGKISSSVSAGMHVRRTDYVTNTNANAFHGTCSPEYYNRAASIIIQKYPSVQFYIFSDDPAWARENLKFAAPVEYVDYNGDKGFEDLRLLSMCDHQVIANSTFSWWAAWLNPNPDKTVIAPSSWFADPSRKTPDLIPSSWQRI